MRQIQNHNLAELLVQLRFTPAKKRHKQLENAEKLLLSLEKDRVYPFEFVFFKITGFPPKDLSCLQPIEAEALADDLRIFISKLSSRLAPPASSQSQKVYTIDQLAETAGVSTKTIHRWRKLGLIARKFIFDDGKKRFGFLQSAVDDFFAANPTLVKKAKAFRRLTKNEKQQIIKRASALARETSLSRRQIIAAIASETQKAHETIRYTIGNYQKANPQKQVFKTNSHRLSPADAAELYRLYNHGTSIRELTCKYRRNKSSIYRIIAQQRAKALLSQKIEFITSAEFHQPDAAEKILSEDYPAPKLAAVQTDKLFDLSNGALTRYFQRLKNIPLLNRQQETELFRKYNYLKFLASTKTGQINLGCVSGRKVTEIKNHLEQAEKIKSLIIKANLRLVVSIAGRHTRSQVNLPDLISEGNFSLMRAVEKFDYTRGFRFATYAAWAIAKDFARKPAQKALPAKAAASMDDIHRDLKASHSADVVAIERARQSLVQVIKDELDPREQYIILNHFALTGSSIRKNKKTLQEIGDRLHLTRERVRQIELIALQKLRHSLSDREFELLTG